MRIILTHPFCWPYVRRGAERFLAELAYYLTTSGEEVYTIASKPGPSITEKGDAGVRILKSQLWFPALGRLRLHPAHAFFFDAYREVRRLRPDVVQSLHFMDALGSALTGSKAKHKSAYYVTGPPIPGYQPRIPPDRWFLKQAILRVNAVAVPSQYVADIVSGYYGRASTLLPVPIDIAHFSPDPRKRSERPLVLWVGASDVPRKGLSQMIRAFARVIERIPGAVLRVSGQTSPQQQRELLTLVSESVGRQIEFTGLGALADLPDHYREAWVTVQPAKWESYGLVILESLACGTPVVAVRHGALPELVTTPDIGSLFDPGGTEDQVGIDNLDGLAAAISDRLAEPVSESEARACRIKAESYSWEVLGPRYLAFYRELINEPVGFLEK